MTGWRIGFVVGNPLIVKAYGDVKDNSDSGQFLAIQKAAVTALKNPSITQSIAAKYSRRFDLLVNALKKSGFDVSKPEGSFFLYTQAPTAAIEESTKERTQFVDAESFSEWLILEQLISTVPWDDSGSYVRFSVTFEASGEEAEKSVINQIESRLGRYQFIF